MDVFGTSLSSLGSYGQHYTVYTEVKGVGCEAITLTFYPSSSPQKCKTFGKLLFPLCAPVSLSVKWEK